MCLNKACATCASCQISDGNMKILLLIVLISVCRGQQTTKHSMTECTCSGALNEELRALREEVQRNKDITNREVGKLETQLKELQNERETKAASAFVAKGLSHGDSEIVYDDDVKLIFRETVYNRGGHYNATSAEYSCPATGLYFFTFTVCGHRLKNKENHLVDIVLVKSDTVSGRVLIYNHNADGLTVIGSQSMVVPCTAGQRMWLKTNRSNNQLIGSLHLNLFSGFLVSAI